MKLSVKCVNRFFQGLFLLFFAQNAAAQNLRVADAFPNLTILFDRPVEFTHAGDFSDRAFVVEQPGVIRVFPNNPNVTDGQVATFLDIRPQIVLGNETGLLGLAFDPAFATNRHFYVYYTRNQNGQLQSVVSRFTASAGTRTKPTRPANCCCSPSTSLLPTTTAAKSPSGRTDSCT